MARNSCRKSIANDLQRKESWHYQARFWRKRKQRETDRLQGMNKKLKIVNNNSRTLYVSWYYEKRLNSFVWIFINVFLNRNVYYFSYLLSLHQLVEENLLSAWIMNKFVMASDDQKGNESLGILNPEKSIGVEYPHQVSFKSALYYSLVNVPLTALMSSALMIVSADGSTKV